MENKALAQIIQNNIRVKNLEEESGGGSGTVIFNDEQGSANFELELTAGKIYEFYISICEDNLEVQYGKQIVKILYDGSPRPPICVFSKITEGGAVDTQSIFYTLGTVSVISISGMAIPSLIYKVIEY